MEYPEQLDQEAWEEYKQHRRETRKPLTPLAEQKAIVKLFRLATECHCKQSEIIDQTIENGWQGLFHLKVENYARFNRQSVGSATAEARRLQAEGYLTGFEDEESDQPTLPQNVINIR